MTDTNNKTVIVVFFVISNEKTLLMSCEINKMNVVSFLKQLLSVYLKIKKLVVNCVTGDINSGSNIFSCGFVSINS